jgi:CDK-activating kinase assembly factor MAT1
MGPRKAGAPDSSTICPVCKSSTYLNPNMIFKVNPECYHKMCDSCVERIFSSGPAPCPVAGCGRTLRKNRFKVPRFADLAIERECDIRARVAKILNLTQDDFDTLRAYNDYEQEKEDLIMDLVAGTNLEEREKQLKAHAKTYADRIKENTRLEEEQREAVKENEKARLQRSENARAEALRERQEELAEREAGRKEVVDKIMNANANVLKVAKEAERVIQRRAAAKQQASTSTGTMGVSAGSGDAPITGTVVGTAGGASANGGGIALTGLKKLQSKQAEDEKPYDPFEGLMLKFKYYSLADNYYHPWSNKVDQQNIYVVGGYAAKEYQRQAQLEAHGGLGIFVAEEKA